MDKATVCKTVICRFESCRELKKIIMVKMMEMVNMQDCDSCVERLVGSSPIFHPKVYKILGVLGFDIYVDTDTAVRG